MKLIKATTLLIAACCIVLLNAGHVSAATLDIPISLTSDINHKYDLNYFEGWDRIGMQTEPLTVDLGTFTNITSTAQAPAGMKYFVDLPDGASIHLILDIGYYAPGGVTVEEYWPHTITLLDVQGVAPTKVSSATRGVIQGLAVELLFDYQVNGDFSFTGFEVSAEYPICLANGGKDYIDLVASCSAFDLAIEIETTPRNVLSNATKANELGLQLWIVTPNKKISSAVARKLRQSAFTDSSQIRILTLGQFLNLSLPQIIASWKG